MRTPLTWTIVNVCAIAPLAGQHALAQDAPEVGVADDKELPGLIDTASRIAFIGHGNLLHFRNIRVKSLAE